MKIYLTINDRYTGEPLAAYESLMMAEIAVNRRQDTIKFTEEEFPASGPDNLISCYWSSDGVISIWEVSFLDRELFINSLFGN